MAAAAGNQGTMSGKETKSKVAVAGKQATSQTGLVTTFKGATPGLGEVIFDYDGSTRVAALFVENNKKLANYLANHVKRGGGAIAKAIKKLEKPNLKALRLTKYQAQGWSRTTHR